jgi:hypothetical protein
MTATARLSFQSFKSSPRMSEETLAFTATVLLDGKAVGTARNDGRGGPNTFVPHDGDCLRAFHAVVKATSVDADYDTVLGDLVEAQTNKL